MRILTLTSLFPGSAQPRHGVFVRERMLAYRERFGGEIKVVAPVPFWPRFLASEKYGAFARAPRSETFGGFEIEHPRYLMIPKVGVPLQGMFYEAGVRSTVRRIQLETGIDVLDAHYAYPDGFAAARLAQRFGLRYVLTVRGTDVNLLPKQGSLAGQIRFALANAHRVVAVASALAELAVEAGADPRRVVVLRNGVDGTKFRPLDPMAARARLGLPVDRRVVVCVGFLVPRKGHALALDALAAMPQAMRPLLVIAGDGPERPALDAKVAALDLTRDVRFLGAVMHEDLAEVFSAADVSLLTSDREGWPNVILESMACGTPVVATAVHGVPEIITSPQLGVLVHERTPTALRTGLTTALEREFDRPAIRAYAESMDWGATATGLHAVFEAVRNGATS